ncbi:MAG TPA: hypothetical protein VFA75_20630 [Nevskia sp.]|nr:hypothetical protein [Nevskia sp.]
MNSHPQVVKGPGEPEHELPDTRIKNFGVGGVTLEADFWMDGIDDGRNRVSADLLLLIWQVLRDNGVEAPVPKRDVRLSQK